MPAAPRAPPVEVRSGPPPVAGPDLPQGVAALAVPAPGPRRWRGLALVAGVWLGLCLALAQPQRIQMVPDRSASGRNIVIALDMSGSMATPDFALEGQTVTRLEAVKQVAEGFICARTGDRIAAVPVAAVVASPLERCAQTARALLDRQPGTVPSLVDDDLTECDYGQWQGRALSDLATEPLWATVQTQPSAVVFPGGESMAGMQARAVAAIRRHDAAVEAEHGPGAVWVAVSHGDVIKSILADALGTHLDLFQRIHVDPASVSVVRYTESRPFVLGTNTHGGDPSWLTPPPKKASRGSSRSKASDAVVGGGAGPASQTAGS